MILKLKKQINKYFVLMKEFGVRIVYLEFILRLVGVLNKNGKLWKKISLTKYKYIQRYLEKDMGDIIEKYNNFSSINNRIEKTAPIWIFWAQGFTKAPELVQMCVSRIKTLSTSHPVIELSLDNIDEYVIIPNVILNKYKNGIISQAHFADFLRFNLLKDYGGIWMDATVYQHDNRTMDSLTDYSFYSIKHGIGTGYLACQGLWSTFFLASSRNNVVSAFVFECMLRYWNIYNSAIDYLFLDSIMYMGYDRIDSIKTLIDNILPNNINTFDLMPLLMTETKRIDNQLWKNSDLFKLTYKYPLLASKSIVKKIFTVE